MKMGEIDIQDYARQLLEAHGDKAVAEAARKASTSEKEGKTEDAETWRRIEAALKLMRGPHQKAADAVSAMRFALCCGALSTPVQNRRETAGTIAPRTSRNTANSSAAPPPMYRTTRTACLGSALENQ
jgi:hypothetical protein